MSADEAFPSAGQEPTGTVAEATAVVRIHVPHKVRAGGDGQNWLPKVLSVIWPFLQGYDVMEVSVRRAHVLVRISTRKGIEKTDPEDLAATLSGAIDNLLL